jgi:16S rRNA G527 N7-methylase RsmG
MLQEISDTSLVIVSLLQMEETTADNGIGLGFPSVIFITLMPLMKAANSLQKAYRQRLRNMPKIAFLLCQG